MNNPFIPGEGPPRDVSALLLAVLLLAGGQFCRSSADSVPPRATAMYAIMVDGNWIREQAKFGFNAINCGLHCARSVN